jgi:hypothetical protein
LFGWERRGERKRRKRRETDEVELDNARGKPLRKIQINAFLMELLGFFAQRKKILKKRREKVANIFI